MDRIEKGKDASGLTSLDCYCLFYKRYLLPCKHIFYEHMYGNMKLLTADIWRMFQEIFEESGFEIYKSYELVMEFVQTKKQKEAENQRLTIVELTERMHDRYWSIEEIGDVRRIEAFISMLKTSINPIILQFDQSNKKK